MNYHVPSFLGLCSGYVQLCMCILVFCTEEYIVNEHDSPVHTVSLLMSLLLLIEFKIGL